MAPQLCRALSSLLGWNASPHSLSSLPRIAIQLLLRRVATWGADLASLAAAAHSQCRHPLAWHTWRPPPYFHLGGWGASSSSSWNILRAFLISSSLISSSRTRAYFLGSCSTNRSAVPMVEQMAARLLQLWLGASLSVVHQGSLVGDEHSGNRNTMGGRHDEILVQLEGA